MPAGFPVASGFWTFREPDAVVIVQNDRLRVAAVPFTRSHDEMQFLDNAKHMYFSTRSFEAPKNGRLTVSGRCRRRSSARTTTTCTTAS
jgi:hypothetical protein